MWSPAPANSLYPAGFCCACFPVRPQGRRWPLRAAGCGQRPRCGGPPRWCEAHARPPLLTARGALGRGRCRFPSTLPTPISLGPTVPGLFPRTRLGPRTTSDSAALSSSRQCRGSAPVRRCENRTSGGAGVGTEAHCACSPVRVLSRARRPTPPPSGPIACALPSNTRSARAAPRGRR